MTTPMKIDFVSDVSCPWCVVGLRSLEQALERVADSISATMHVQPFELNPQMKSGGQDIVEHLQQKYGSTRDQLARNSEAIRARGAELGFAFRMDLRGRIYNTFDAHRLLHWANLEGCGVALKHALFAAYFTHGEDPSDPETLIRLATEVGLDAIRAREILASDQYASEVRAIERYFQEQGINAVPAVIINDRHLISGGQPVEVFEQALRQLAQARSA